MTFRVHRTNQPFKILYPPFPSGYSKAERVEANSFDEITKRLTFNDGDVIVNPNGLRFRLIHGEWEEIN